MDDEEAVIFSMFLLLKRRNRLKKKTKKKNRSQWIRPIYQHREEKGIYHTLVQEMALGDREFYFK